MPSSRKPVDCSGPGRRDVLRAGVLGFLGLGLDDWFRLRAEAGDAGRPAVPVRNCILIWLAGGPSHLDTFDPKPAAPAGHSGRVQADRDLGPWPADQRGLSQPGQDDGSGDVDPQHDLARGRPRPRLASPDDRLSALPGARLSQPRQRGLEDEAIEPRDVAALCRHPGRSGVLIERIPDAGLRPVRGLGRSQPGELPGPQPDAARPAHPGAPAPPPGHGQVTRRVCPRRSCHAADDQPRPVRRPGLFADDLQRDPGRLPTR